MAKIQVHGWIRKAGNSVALIIPASQVKRSHIRPGRAARAEIELEEDDAFGFLSDLYDGAFRRAREEPKLARD